MVDETKVAELSVAYRRLVMSVAAQLVFSCGVLGMRVVEPSLASSLLRLALLLGVFVTLGFAVYYGYRTAAALNSGEPWLWALGMFIPCGGNLITVGLLSSRATRACAALGIPVGFLGPRSPAPDVARKGGGEAG